jgi:hypothetical protein
MKWIPKILSLTLLWGAVGVVVFTVEPELIRDVLIPDLYLPFYLLLMITIWYSLALITKTMMGSLLLTITLIGALMLSMMRLMHLGLALVILLTLVMESWYIYHRHEKIHSTHEQKNRGTGI